MPKPPKVYLQPSYILSMRTTRHDILHSFMLLQKPSVRVKSMVLSLLFQGRKNTTLPRILNVKAAPLIGVAHGYPTGELTASADAIEALLVYVQSLCIFAVLKMFFCAQSNVYVHDSLSMEQWNGGEPVSGAGHKVGGHFICIFVCRPTVSLYHCNTRNSLLAINKGLFIYIYYYYYDIISKQHTY